MSIEDGRQNTGTSSRTALARRPNGASTVHKWDNHPTAGNPKACRQHVLKTIWREQHRRGDNAAQSSSRRKDHYNMVQP